MGDVPGVNSGGGMSPEQLLAEQKKHDLRMSALKFQSAIAESETSAKNRMAEAMARAGS